ncbi:hypothetical protein MKW92_015513 [Papaver armeniacum]|nr:hypothetical protein MKW92_015513 [Papaver armeniacum]
MKREGRQHGMVRSFLVLPSPLNPTPKSKIVNALDSRPTAGAFTKVSRKPTNHSKFTGKCGVARCTDCHINPGNKSKDKAKGTQKLKSCSAAMNQRSLALDKPLTSLEGSEEFQEIEFVPDCQAEEHEGWCVL